jgi:hypothetical protein
MQKSEFYVTTVNFAKPDTACFHVHVLLFTSLDTQTRQAKLKYR